jgi:hypothetical protein
VISILLLAVLLQETIATDAGCVKCHGTQEDDWKGSVHATKGVGCIRCHGTESVDPAKSKPHLFQAGFRRGTRKSSADVCGECHQKEAAQWGASAHGEDTRDEAGRSRGCSSCHAFHETPIANPREILKENCLRCHKPGTEAIRFGELITSVADRFPGGTPQALRIEQHAASANRLRERVDAYNKSDRGATRPPWLWVVPAVPAAAAVILWFRSGKRRQP